MDGFSDFLANAGNTASHYIPILIGIAVSFIQCFFGFKFFRYIMGFWGFALFGYVGYSIGSLFENQNIAIWLCIILGAVGAVIAYKYYSAGVFLQGLLAGLVIGMITGVFFGLKPVPVVAFGIVLGILLGLATMYLLKPLIILTSAITGGMSGSLSLAGMLRFPHNAGVFLGILISALGIGYQFYSMGKEKGIGKKKEKSDKGKKDEQTEKEEALSPPDTSEQVLEAPETASYAEPGAEDVQEPVEYVEESIAEEAVETLAETPAEDDKKE